MKNASKKPKQKQNKGGNQMRFLGIPEDASPQTIIKVDEPIANNPEDSGNNIIQSANVEDVLDVVSEIGN
jgi:hypothetical protein